MVKIGGYIDVPSKGLIIITQILYEKLINN